MYIKNILLRGFCSKVKIVASQVFPTPPKVIFFLSKQGSSGEVLVEEVGQGEVAFLERVQLWSEVLWGHR